MSSWGKKIFFLFVLFFLHSGRGEAFLCIQPSGGFTASSYSFGSVIVGSQATRTATIRYLGSCVYPSPVVATISVPPGFSANPSTFTIENAQVVDVTITFSPASAVTYSGTMTVSFTGGMRSDSVSVSGSGLPPPTPVPALSADTLDFGSVTVGGSTTRSFTLRNTGGGMLAGSASSSSAFSVSPQSFGIGAGGSQSFTVTFAPGSGGIFSGNVSFSSAFVSIPQVSLAGVGYQPQPNITTNVTDFDFGQLQVNSSSSRILSVSNVGDATLTGSLDISAPFSLSGTSLSVGPGSAQSFTINAIPSARGDFTGQVTIDSNDPDVPTIPLGLSVTGVAPYLQIAPGSYNFGSTPLGEVRTTTITISNLNNTFSNTLNLSSFQMAGGAFSFTGPSVTSLSPGQSATVQVNFNPTVNGFQTDNLSLNSNDPSNSSPNIALRGTGVSPSVNPSTLNLSWGDIHLGGSLSRVLNLANNGTSTLTITSFISPSTAVTASPSTVSIAPGGGSQDFEVRFAPTSETTLSGDLIVRSNDPQLPSLTIGLTGRGVTPRISVVDSLNFENVAVDPRNLSNAGILDLPLVIQNNGGESLTISNVESNHPAFSPLSTTITVPPATERTLQVRYRPTAIGDQSGALTIYSNDYYLPVRTISLAGRGISALDLTVSNFEVTQAIQTTDNSLPLVASKPTEVRVFIDAELFAGQNSFGGMAPMDDDTIRNVDGILRVFRSGNEVYGSPLQSQNGPIDVVPNPDRGTVNHTLNFHVPGYMTQCGSCSDSVNVEFRLEINPATGARVARHLESDYQNNLFAWSSTFWNNYQPRIHYIPLSILGRPLPSVSAMVDGTKLFKKIFPLSGITYVRRPPLAVGWDITLGNYKKVLVVLFFASHLGNVTPPDRTFGWYPFDYSASGWAEDIPGRVGMGMSNPTDAEQMFAHEIGHTYGLCHTHKSVGEHCPGGYTDNHTTDMGTISEVGFDTEEKETILPVSAADWSTCTSSNLANCPGSGAIDFMAYKPTNPSQSGNYRRWVHPQRYQFLFERLRSRLADPANARGCGHILNCTGVATIPSLLVAGSISPEGAGEIQPIYQTDSIPDSVEETSEGNSVLVRAIDASGNLIFEFPLVDAGGMTGFEGNNEKTFTFNLILPDLEGVEKIQLIRGGQVIAERSKTNHAPVVTLTSPQGGGLVQGMLNVAWTATDEDGDRLSYSVLYSINGGEVFETIGVELHQASLQYDTAKLGGSDRAVVRVVVTDGFNTTSVDSQPFRVTSKPPRLVILSPAEGQTIFNGTNVTLEAEAFDPEDGPIPDDSIQWESDLEGPLGTGHSLGVTLPLGSHTLTVTATDRDGNSVSQDVSIIVVNGALAPRADAGPDQSADEGFSTILDATASGDPNEGDTLTFEWRQLEGPTVTLDDPTSATPVFTAPSVTADTLLKFLVTVTDQTGNSATDSVHVVVLNAFYSELHLSTSEIDFGSVAMGDSTERIFSIQNDGNEPLEVTGLEISRSAFTAGPSSVTVLPGESASLTVRFAPNEPAQYDATLRVLSNTVVGVNTIVVLKGSSPEPEKVYDDTGVGGNLVPTLEATPNNQETPTLESVSDTEEEDVPASSDVGSEIPSATDESGDLQGDRYQFVGIGGCSLVRM